MSGKRLALVGTRFRDVRVSGPKQAVENRIRALDSAIASLADRVQLYMDDEDALGIQTLIEDQEMLQHAARQVQKLAALLGVEVER